MICPNCGVELEDNAESCFLCCAVLELECDTEQTVEAEPVIEDAARQESPNAGSSPMKKKNSILIVILVILIVLVLVLAAVVGILLLKNEHKDTSEMIAVQTTPHFDERAFT